MIRLTTLTKFTGAETEDYLLQWSDMTKNSCGVIPREPEYFVNRALFAILAFDGKLLVGAAGLIRGVEAVSNTDLFFDGKPVVELGSNVVCTEYGGRGIGTAFVERRLAYARSKKMFSVSITGKPEMRHIFKKIGAEQILDFSSHEGLFKKIRKCGCVGENTCKICPWTIKTAWVFPDN